MKESKILVWIDKRIEILKKRRENTPVSLNLSKRIALGGRITSFNEIKEYIKLHKSFEND